MRKLLLIAVLLVFANPESTADTALYQLKSTFRWDAREHGEPHFHGVFGYLTRYQSDGNGYEIYELNLETGESTAVYDSGHRNRVLGVSTKYLLAISYGVDSSRLILIDRKTRAILRTTPWSNTHIASSAVNDSHAALLTVTDPPHGGREVQIIDLADLVTKFRVRADDTRSVRIVDNMLLLAGQALARYNLASLEKPEAVNDKFTKKIDFRKLQDAKRFGDYLVALSETGSFLVFSWPDLELLHVIKQDASNSRFAVTMGMVVGGSVDGEKNRHLRRLFRITDGVEVGQVALHPGYLHSLESQLFVLGTAPKYGEGILETFTVTNPVHVADPTFLNTLSSACRNGAGSLQGRFSGYLLDLNACEQAGIRRLAADLPDNLAMPTSWNWYAKTLARSWGRFDEAIAISKSSAFSPSPETLAALRFARKKSALITSRAHRESADTAERVHTLPFLRGSELNTRQTNPFSYLDSSMHSPVFVEESVFIPSHDCRTAISEFDYATGRHLGSYSIPAELCGEEMFLSSVAVNTERLFVNYESLGNEYSSNSRLFVFNRSTRQMLEAATVSKGGTRLFSVEDGVIVCARNDCEILRGDSGFEHRQTFDASALERKLTPQSSLMNGDYSESLGYFSTMHYQVHGARHNVWDSVKLRISSRRSVDYLETFFDTFDAESIPISDSDELVLREKTSAGCSYSLYDISSRSMRSLFDLSECGPLVSSSDFLFVANGNDFFVYDRQANDACNYILDALDDLTPTSRFDYDKGQLAGLSIVGKWLFVSSHGHARDVIVELSELTSCRL